MSREGDIPAGYGGLIQEPHRNDVLSGRGGRINAHHGNVKFRELVKEYRPVYLSNETKKLDKVKIASRIVTIIRSLDPPGRFLKEESKAWVEIGDEKARKKAGQAMREKAEDFRKGQQQQQTHGNLVNSPQQMLPRYASTSQNATSPTSATFVTPNTDPYLQMNSSFQQNSYPQNLMTMPPLQQMNFQQIPSGHQQQYGNMEIPPTPSSNDSSKNNLGMLTGNSVAFNREFNRMSSSESGNAPNSVNVSSMGSINTSMSSANRSSLSSRSSARETNRSVQIMEPIHDDVEVEESIASAWDDSWDQEPSLKDGESVKSVESERRKNMFRNMKNESSTLPAPNLAVTDNIGRLNENDLMKESLVSVEMQSVEMKKSVNFLDNKSMQMDSINELIVETLNSDDDIKSASFSMTSNDRKNMMIAQAGVNQVGMVLEKPNHPTRGISGVSTASGISATSEAQSWAAIENNHSTLPDLPVGLTDNSRQQQFTSDSVNRHTNIIDEDNRGRIFSDYSNK